jgi:hypothetical protein
VTPTFTFGRLQFIVVLCYDWNRRHQRADNEGEDEKAPVQG